VSGARGAGLGALAKGLLPRRARPIEVLGRALWLSPARDLHLWRLALAHRLAPAHHELSALVSLMGFVGPGMTFVDVGANVGLYATAFASVGEHAGFDVVAVEPLAEAAERLERGLARYSNCRVLRLACSDADGEAVLVPGADTLTARLASGPAEGVRVATATLDRLLAGSANRLVIKVDVEGHEGRVVAGARGLLESGRIAALLVDGTGSLDLAVLARAGLTALDARTLVPVERAYTMIFAPA